jgi:CRP-like cAMP-binding protein
MDIQDHVELLSRVDVFESLSEEEIRELLRDLLQRNAEINLRAGEVFYTPQQPDGKLFILTKGRVRLYKLEATREFTLEVVDAGTVFGEVAFTPHAFRESYAQAMEPSVVFAMERAEVERLILQKDNKPPLRAPALLRDAHAGRDSQRGASKACEPDPLPRQERGGAETRGDSHTHKLHS